MMNLGDIEYLICTKHNTRSWKKGDYCDECKIEQLEAENIRLRTENAELRANLSQQVLDNGWLASEIARLKEELATAEGALKKHMIHSQQQTESRIAEYQKMQEELSAAQKDAERYRWIMNNQDMVRHALEFGDTTKENADAAIDAAIAAEKGEKK